jgi:hypothetical protein
MARLDDSRSPSGRSWVDSRSVVGKAIRIQEIEKSQHEVVRIELHEYRGRWYLSARTWFRREASGAFAPSRAGLNIRFDLLPAFLEAVQEAATGAGRGESDLKDSGSSAKRAHRSKCHIAVEFPAVLTRK